MDEYPEEKPNANHFFPNYQKSMFLLGIGIPTNRKEKPQQEKNKIAEANNKYNWAENKRTGENCSIDKEVLQTNTCFHYYQTRPPQAIAGNKNNTT